MNTWKLLVPVVVLAGSFCLSTPAQVYSPRRLTQRIAPQTAQPAPGAPASPGMAPAPVVHAPLAPAKSLANASTNAEAPQKLDEPVAAPQPPPLTIDCKKLEIDPNSSLQSILLTLTNTSAKAVSYVTMHMIYMDNNGLRLKDWTTRRELDPPLPPNTSMELDQPAYFMPLVTKRVKVELLSAKFTDGADWSPGAMTVASH
jgi:hypothetical protein